MRYSHRLLVPLLYIQDIFRCVGKEDSRSASHGKRIIWVLNGKERCGKKRKRPVFLVVVKRILILATHTTAEREKQKSNLPIFTGKEKSYKTYVIMGSS